MTERRSRDTAVPDRRIDAGARRHVVVGVNRSALHAALWLERLGATLAGVRSIEAARALDPRPTILIVAGDALHGPGLDAAQDLTRVVLWDNEVGRPGIGDLASAVSGVSAVIGRADGPPGVLPAHIPEKWAGLFGASLVLALQAAEATPGASLPRRIDVSAADALRAFAEQNSGNHAGVPYGWRRNGRTAVEHGGVFPQGFFECRDGFMAVQARSRTDWQAILAALGNPPWSNEAEFQNPFSLSEDDGRVMPLLHAALTALGRRELLERALATGAPMAPVLSLEETRRWDVARPGSFDDAGRPRPPYTVRRRT